MTQDAKLEVVNIGQMIRTRIEESGLSLDQLGGFPQAQIFSDLRGNTWRTNACIPSKSYPGHTAMLIASDDDGSVRVYAAPVMRDAMTPPEKKAAEQHGGTYLIFRMRVDVPSLVVEAFGDPESFAAVVALELRKAFDTFVDEIDQATEADLVVDYLRGLPAGTTLAQAIADLDANKHLEEGEEPEETPTNGASASASASPPVAS